RLGTAGGQRGTRRVSGGDPLFPGPFHCVNSPRRGGSMTNGHGRGGRAERERERRRPTKQRGSDFDEALVLLATDLRSYCERRRRIDAHELDDLIQEVCARLLA